MINEAKCAEAPEAEAEPGAPGPFRSRTMVNQLDGLARELGRRGQEVGLAAVGIAPATPMEATRRLLEDRKSAGLSGGMQFTYRNPARSTDPGRILAGAAASGGGGVAVRSGLGEGPRRGWREWRWRCGGWRWYRRQRRPGQWWPRDGGGAPERPTQGPGRSLRPPRPLHRLAKRSRAVGRGVDGRRLAGAGSGGRQRARRPGRGAASGSGLVRQKQQYPLAWAGFLVPPWLGRY